MMKKEFMLSISVFDSSDEEKIVLFRDINKKLYRKIQKLIDKKEQKVKSFKGLKEPLNDLAISQIPKERVIYGAKWNNRLDKRAKRESL